MATSNVPPGETEIAPAPAPPRKSSFPALRHRDFRLLWIGQLISVTGTQMQLVAINWHIYVLTKSPLALGGVGLVRVIPIILCSLVGGVVADTVNRRRLMMITQSVMLVSAALLAFLTARNVESIWVIYLLTAIGSAAFAFDNPARQALLPTLVPPRDFQNAVSLGIVVFQAATVAGPAIGGLLLARHGPALIYALNAGSFLAVIVAVVLMKVSGDPVTGSFESPRFSFAALSEGLRFVWRTPIIVQTMTLDFIATFFASSTALLPIFAAEILLVGPKGLGLLAAAPAAGSVITGLIMARLGPTRRQGLTVIVSICVYGAATLAFGISRFFWVSLALLAIVGASDTVSTVLRQTIRQLRTPDHLRGRMTSVNMIFFIGGPQLGEMEAGTAARFLGSPLAVITGGIGCLLAAGIVALRSKTLLQYQGHETD